MATTAVWFGANHPYLFAWIHTPASGPQAPAVVLCPGLGRDGANAHHTYRRLAMQLAEAGLMVIRFDYEGTGDSAGDGLGSGRADAWIQSISAAVTLARSQGATSVSLVGLRVGALLAEHAAETIADLKALVLWDPVPSGRAFVRGQRALEAFGGGTGTGQGELSGIPWLSMSQDGLQELTDLKPPPEARRQPMPMLLLHRPSEATADHVRTRLASHPVESIEVTEQYEFLEVDPVRNSVPEQTLAEIVTWLRATLLTAPGAAGTDSEAAISRGAAPGVTSDHAVVQADSALGPIVESTVRLGPLGLFGIETVAERSKSSLPTIMFLNSGNISHVSPGRLWVRTARALAELGFRCVRFDLSGLGDSSPRPGQAEQVPFPPEAFQDIEEAALALSGEDPGNVVFVGLSSGGYHALELGLRLQPRAVCVVNPSISFTPPELAYGRLDPRRRVCVPKSKVTAAAARRITIPALHRPLVRLAWLLRHLRYRDRSQSRWLRELVDAGVSVYGICASQEAVGLLGGPAVIPAELDPTGRLRVDVIDGLHHALIPQDHQQLVADRLTAYLTEQFLTDPDGREPVRSGGASGAFAR